MKKLGLCLAGGGARGSYQIGVMKALEELGYLKKVKAISGTSIGSVNASVFAGKTVDDMKEIWFNYSTDEFKKNTKVFSKLKNKKLEVVKEGIYELEALGRLLKKNLDVKALRNQETYVTLSPAGEKDDGIKGILKASYKHYIKHESQVIYSPLHEQDDKSIYQQVLASCSIPVVFPSMKIGEKQVFDGGLYDNVPVKPLVDAGCDEIIVIHLQRIFFVNKSKYPGVKFHEIKHWGSLGGLLNFDANQAEKRYELGYKDGMKYFTENPLN